MYVKGEKGTAFDRINGQSGISVSLHIDADHAVIRFYALVENNRKRRPVVQVI